MSNNKLLGSIASSCERPLTRSSMSSFFIARPSTFSHQVSVATAFALAEGCQLMPDSFFNTSAPSCPPCAPNDATTHRLYVFESLLAQPVGDTQGTHAVMAHHHDVLIGIEFLMRARRDIAHGHLL